MTILPEEKAGNARGQVSSARLKTTKQHSQKPSYMLAAWHFARFLAASLCSRAFVLYGLLSPSDTSSTSSGGSAIPIACHRDWHWRCSTICRGNACKGLARAITAYFPLRWSPCWQPTLDSTLQFALGMLQQPSGVQGHTQSVGNNSTQKRT